MKSALLLLTLCVSGSLLTFSGPLGIQAAAPGIDGVAHPRRVVQVGSATSGLLRSVHVDRGDRVEAGQVVARLDAQVLSAQAELAQARADAIAGREMVAVRLADARRRLAKQEGLSADGFAPEDSVDAIRTEVHLEELALAQEDEAALINQLELKRSQAMLAQSTILSPVTGVVTERYLSPGELLDSTSSSVVITVVELDPLVVEVHAPIEMFDQVQVGRGVVVHLDAIGNPQRTATVTLKDHIVETASRTFRVQIELPNPNYELPAGLRCRVVFKD